MCRFEDMQPVCMTPEAHKGIPMNISTIALSSVRAEIRSYYEIMKDIIIDFRIAISSQI